MTNKEAIEQLEWVEERICKITYSPESFEAINLAIKALEERPTGEWEYVGIGIYECTNCKAEYEAGIYDHCNVNNSEFRFCPNCGADMRGDL